MLNVGPLLVSVTPLWEWGSMKIVKIGVFLLLIDAMFGLAAYGHFWSLSQYAKRREVTVSLVLREFAQQCAVSAFVALSIFCFFMILVGPGSKLFVLSAANGIVLGDVGMRLRRMNNST
jgi:hypothetical protein